MSPAPADGGRRIPRRDGWTATVLGAAAQGYLTLQVALTAVAVLPLLLGWHGTIVQTGSMRPHVDPGDVVLLTALPTSEPVPLGGVVQFHNPSPGMAADAGPLRIHRIVAESERDGEWVTAGDANPDVDSATITREHIQGQARLLIPWVGLPSLWIRGGAYGALLLWLAGSAAALGILLWWRPRLTAAWAPSAQAAPAGPGPAAPSGPDADRRGTMSLLLVLAAGGMALWTTEPSYAGFSARTRLGGNTFQVASWGQVSLGRAAPFALLGRTRLLGNATSRVLGSVAVSPGTSITSFGAAAITGTVERNTAAAVGARADAIALAAAARQRPVTGTLPANVTGTLVAGVYQRTSTVHLRGIVTLDAQGDSTALFILLTGAFTVAPGAQLLLRGGASANRVFVVSTAQVAVGDGCVVNGNLLCEGEATVATGSSVVGRVVSLDAGVTLTGATVALP